MSRVKLYKPQAIVSVLLRIAPIVEGAAIDAGCDATRRVPFPGMGNQARFHAAMRHIIPDLPRNRGE